MKVTAHSFFGYNGGASQHATNFFDALERRGVEVLRSQLNEPGRVPTDGIHIFLCGVQEFSGVMKNSAGIKGTRIGYVAWESTRYPRHFIDALDQIDQLWVPSVWQRDCTIAQLTEEEPERAEEWQRFVRVVPEGVDPAVFHPGEVSPIGPMRFMIFGRWEDRKCTKEMISQLSKVFPPFIKTELLISADNAFPVDQYKTTEERLDAYGFHDPRIKVVHFPPKEEYVRYLQEGHVLLNVSRGEGWGLPIIEGMACGIPTVCLDWSGNTEFCKDACLVGVDKMIKPFNVYGVPDCPGEWAEPDWASYRWWLRELYDHYQQYRDQALQTAVKIQSTFSWDMAAERALELLRSFDDSSITERVKKDAAAMVRKFPFPNVGKDDDDFQRHFAPARYGGLVDEPRCRVLYEQLTKALKMSGEIWECGVYRGHTAAMLASICKDAGRELHLFDSFEGLPEPCQFDQHRKGEFAATMEEARARIGHGDLVHFHKGWIPDSFHDASIAFAHVDVDLYLSTLDCCRYIWPRLAPGGVIIFDDYGFETTRGSRKAVDEFFAEKGFQVNVLPTGQAMAMKWETDAMVKWDSASVVSPPSDEQIEMIASAFRAGYEVDQTAKDGVPRLRKKERSVFVITGVPDSAERLATLRETITDQIHKMGYKAIVATKYPLPATVLEVADYYLYVKESDNLPIPPEHILQDVLRFCEGAWDRVHFLAYDVEVDLPEFLCRVAMSASPVVVSSRVGQDLMSGTTMALVDVFDDGDWSRTAQMDIPAEHRFKDGGPKTWAEDRFDCHFVQGAFLQINGDSPREYRVVFGTPNDPDEYELIQKPGMWSRPKKKYFKDWTVRAELAGKEVFRHHIDLKGKRVMIVMGSKALGDTLAWIPYVAEFQKKHDCHVICPTWWREILDYPELELVAPGTGHDKLYASYEVGCFDNDLDRNVVDWRLTPLQQVASDILGLDYESLKPRVKWFEGARPAGKYVCFSDQSTMQTKYWNRPGAWQAIVDYCICLGYEVVSISKEPCGLHNVKKFNRRKIEDTIAVLQGAAFYIGLGSGPSWLAWALDVPTIMISGFSMPWEEFPTEGRVINTDVCHGCFNDPAVPFDRGWEWCGRKEWMGRPVIKYECTGAITPEMVKAKIDQIIA